MTFIRAVLAYDGSAFNGWAAQRKAGGRDCESGIVDFDNDSNIIDSNILESAKDLIQDSTATDSIIIDSKSIADSKSVIDSKPAPQGVADFVESALKRVGALPNSLVAASRTDAGVHATFQVVKFALPYAPKDLEIFKNLLNSKLYPSVFCRDLGLCQADFHPRFDASARSYRYILTDSLPNPFLSRFVSVVKIKEPAKIAALLPHLIGEHDFKFFKIVGSPTKSDVRRVYSARFYACAKLPFGRYEIQKFKQDSTPRQDFSKNQDSTPRQDFSKNQDSTPREVFYIFSIKANGFLRSQIRLLMGALIAHANGDLSKEEFLAQLNAQKKFYSMPLPPNGLCLNGIWY